MKQLLHDESILLVGAVERQVNSNASFAADFKRRNPAGCVDACKSTEEE